MRRAIQAASIIFCLYASNVAYAEQYYNEYLSAVKYDWFLDAGYTFGGDRVNQFQFADGSSSETTAGDGLHIGGGSLITINRHFQLQTSINYFIDYSSADNGDMRVARFTFDAIPFYKRGKHRIGAGFSVHVNPTLFVEVNNQDTEVDFETSYGGSIEYGYQLDKKYYIGLRGTAMNYELQDSAADFAQALGKNELDASHVGLFVYGLF